MLKYQESLQKYSKVAEFLSTEAIGLVMNIILDKVGSIGADTPATKDLYQLRDSLLYRQSAIGWHLHSLCKQHQNLEQIFASNPQNFQIVHAQSVQFFIFDNFIFNLLSLYDYFGNLVAYHLISQNKIKMGWPSLIRAAMDSSNKFSKSPIASHLCVHNHSWVKTLQDFRAELIHYNLNMGKGRLEINWKEDEDVKFHVKFSIPEKLSKKLDLFSPTHDHVGIDLQLGALEIAEKSVQWIGNMTETIRRDLTANKIQRTQKQNTESPIKTNN